MGSKDGPLNLFCDGDWSFSDDDKCKAVSSHKTIVGLRVGIGIFVGIVVILGIIGCYKVIKSPEETYITLQK